MPRFTTPDGRTVYVPGVYSDIRVVKNIPGALPDFQIPIIMGQGDEASYPYNFASVKQAVESPHIPFVALGTSTAAAKEYGPDSELAVGMAWAKRHGLPFAYLVAVNALTRAKVIATSTGPVNQITIFAKKFGAAGGHIKLQVVGGTTVSVTPVRRYSLLTKNAASGATRLYVKDNSWLKAGDSVVVGDNNSANATFVVGSTGSELGTSGQIEYFVELTTTLGSAIDTAQYGMVLQYDTDHVQAPAAFANVQGMVDWFNSGDSYYLGAVNEAGFTNPAALVALATATPIKEIAAWSTVTVGTSPASTSGDHTTFRTNLNATDWDAFAVSEQVIPQAFLLLSSSSTIHQGWRDFAVTKRTEGYPISITAGCAWGDTNLSASDDTNPTVRAAALNSQDFMLCAGGLDKIASYLSLASAVYGRRIEGGVGHNLTNDDLLYSEVEKQWDERNNLQLTALHKKGVVSYRLSTAGPIRYRISQGLTTLQNNSSSWNEVDKTTPLAMQRDLADFTDRVMKSDLDGTQIGADEVTPATIAAVMIRRAEKSLLRRGYITSFTIDSITLDDTGAGYNVAWTVRHPVTNDFIGLVTNILIGEE